MNDPEVTPEPALRTFLVQQGLATAGEAVQWTPLTGGVSSEIWRVDLADRTICVKRALARLKVAQEWRAPVARNAYEWAWLCFANAACPGAAPEPIAHDAKLGLFAMAFLPGERYPVWKQLLLQGIADVATAREVGTTLARLHATSAGDATLARSFDTDAIFHAIRIEPYLLATARRHPDLAPLLCALAERTEALHVALVHGDVSPKNILVGPAGPVFIDAECAWYGDPAFDLAFCLNHFLLKCLARPQASDGYLACFAALADAYLDGVTWESRARIEARTATLLPGLFLARVDGKSPVEYVTTDADRERVRSTARDLLQHPVPTLPEVAARWRATLAEVTPVAEGPGPA